MLVVVQVESFEQFGGLAIETSDKFGTGRGCSGWLAA